MLAPQGLPSSGRWDLLDILLTMEIIKLCKGEMGQYLQLSIAQHTFNSLNLNRKDFWNREMGMVVGDVLVLQW
jgi:hypothetical protein